MRVFLWDFRKFFCNIWLLLWWYEDMRASLTYPQAYHPWIDIVININLNRQLSKRKRALLSSTLYSARPPPSHTFSVRPIHIPCFGAEIPFSNIADIFSLLPRYCIPGGTACVLVRYRSTPRASRRPINVSREKGNVIRARSRIGSYCDVIRRSHSGETTWKAYTDYSFNKNFFRVSMS